MRFELIHDTIARQVFFKASTEARQRRKMEKFIHDAYERYKSAGTLLTQDDVEYINPFRDAINISDAQEAYIDESIRELEAASRRRRRTIAAVIAVLALISAVAVIQSFVANNAKDDAIAARDSTEIALEAAEIAEAEAQDNAREAQEQRLIAEAARDTAEHALETARIAEQAALDNAEVARQQRAIAVEARDSTLAALIAANIARRDALRSQINEELARERAEDEREKNLGIALASRASSQLKSGNAETAALLAREAFHFDNASGGHFQNEVYNALRQTLNAIAGPNAGGPMELSSTAARNDAGHNDWVRTIVYNPARDELVSAGNDGFLHLWQANEDPLNPIEGHGRATIVRDLAISPQGNMLASIGDDRQLQLWTDFGPNPDRTPYELSESGGIVRALAFSPDGHYLSMARGDTLSGETGRLLIYDVTEGGIDLAPWYVDTEGFVVRSLVYSPDSEWVVTGSDDGNLRIWRARDAAEPWLQAAHKGSVNTVAFGQENGTTYLATAGEDRIVQVWTWVMAGDQPQLTLYKELRGHDGVVNAVTFSPDGQKLASGSADQSILLWDIHSEEQAENPVILREDGHTSWVQDVTFTSDGQGLYSGSADRTVRHWRINPAELAQNICTALPGASLALDEWQRFAGQGVDYPASCAR